MAFQVETVLAPLSPAEPKSWIGERTDPETGLTYLHARYYDASLGRFLSPDWWDVSDPGVGTDRYGYSLGDPVNNSDPNSPTPPLLERMLDGLRSLVSGGAGVAAGVAAGAATIWLLSTTPAGAPDCPPGSDCAPRIVGTSSGGGHKPTFPDNGTVVPPDLESGDAVKERREHFQKLKLAAADLRFSAAAAGTPFGTPEIPIHGNSKLSPRLAYLYELYQNDGTFLKYGVSQNPTARYTKGFMTDKDILRIASGTRADMLQLERQLTISNPGPMNMEPWARAARAAGRGK